LIEIESWDGGAGQTAVLAEVGNDLARVRLPDPLSSG
jgi:hypothetical protein